MPLVKWVTCAVTDRTAFHQGQLAWSALRDLPGFGGQYGGWLPDGRACIVALWSDEPAYQAFMTGTHDTIAAAQTGTYTTLEVHVLPAPAPIPTFTVEPAWSVYPPRTTPQDT